MADMTKQVHIASVTDPRTMRINIVYTFDPGRKTTYLEVNQESLHSPHPAECIQELRIKVYGIAAQMNYDRDELWKMTARVMFTMKVQAYRKEPAPEWNGDVKAPPTQAEVERAWRELGMLDDE